MNKTYIFIAAAIVVLAGSLWYYTSLNIETAHNDALPPTAIKPTGSHEESPPEVSENVSARAGEDALASFSCKGGTTMTAVFMRDIVDITLSDGRQMTLTQAMSGSGIRYTNESGSIEFRGKGSDAYLQEGETITYADCVAQ